MASIDYKQILAPFVQYSVYMFSVLRDYFLCIVSVHFHSVSMVPRVSYLSASFVPMGHKNTSQGNEASGRGVRLGDCEMESRTVCELRRGDGSTASLPSFPVFGGREPDVVNRLSPVVSCRCLQASIRISHRSNTGLNTGLNPNTGLYIGATYNRILRINKDISRILHMDTEQETNILTDYALCPTAMEHYQSSCSKTTRNVLLQVIQCIWTWILYTNLEYFSWRTLFAQYKVRTFPCAFTSRAIFGCGWPSVETGHYRKWSANLYTSYFSQGHIAGNSMRLMTELCFIYSNLAE